MIKATWPDLPARHLALQDYEIAEKATGGEPVSIRIHGYPGIYR